MGRGAGQGRAGGIDADDLGRAAGQGRHREPAGIAVAVQHRLAAVLAHAVGELLAVVALVEVVAGLVALGHVEAELPLMLGDDDLGAPLAAQPAGLLGQAFKVAHLGVGTLVQAGQAGRGQQLVGDERLPALAAGRQELRHQGVGIAVDDQARQAVGLAMDQAQRVGRDRQPRPQGQRPGDALLEEAGIDALGLIETPDAHPDHRTGAGSAPAEKGPGGRFDPHGLTAVGAAAGHRALEDPGMAALQRALLAGANDDFFHAAIVALLSVPRHRRRSRPTDSAAARTGSNRAGCANGRCRRAGAAAPDPPGPAIAPRPRPA